MNIFLPLAIAIANTVHSMGLLPALSEVEVY